MGWSPGVQEGSCVSVWWTAAKQRLKQSVTKCLALTWGGTSGPTWFNGSQLSLCGQSKYRQAGRPGRWQKGALSRHQTECFCLDRSRTECCVVSDTSDIWGGEDKGSGGRGARVISKTEGKWTDRQRDISPVWADVWIPQGVAAVKQHSVFTTRAWWE